MRAAWTRTTFPRWCCEILHPPGTPFLAIEVASVTRTLWRCPACAGEAVPADLPPIAAPAAPWAGTRRLRIVRSQTRDDWKARQSGEREPGEEG